MLNSESHVESAVRPWLDYATNAVREYPVKAVAVAFGLGFAAALVIRPRNPLLRFAFEGILATALAIGGDVAKKTLATQARTWLDGVHASN